MTFIGNILWRLTRNRVFDPIRPRIWRYNVYQLTGKTKQSEHNLSTIVFAEKEIAEYFSKLIYAKEPMIKFLGKRFLSDIPSLTEKAEHDLTIVETNRSFSHFLFDNGFFALPQINFVLDIKNPIEAIFSKFSRSKIRYTHKIIQLGYTYETTRDPAKLRSFYYEMYLPHMLAKHGKSARPVSYSLCKKFVSNGFLVLIKLNGEYVSGMILVANRNELYQPIVAVKNTGKSFSLASYATKYYTIILGKQKGYGTIDFGDAPPFLSDGLFIYKTEWGMRIRPPQKIDEQVFGIKFSNMNEAVKDFLSTNPFIFSDGENLRGLTLLDSDTKSVPNLLNVPGLSSLFVISTNFRFSNLDLPQIKKRSLGDHDIQASIPLSRLMRMCHLKDLELRELPLKN